MKFARRVSLFVSVILLMMFSVSSPHQASPAPEKIIDPACVAVCILVMQDCFSSDKGHAGRCLGVYHHCIAQCGKD